MTSNDAYSSRDTELLPGSIEQYIDDDVPTCQPGWTIDQIRATLTGRTFASVDEVAVLTDDGIPRLVGLIPIGTVLAAAPSLTAADVMDSDPPVIHRGFNEEQAAWKAVRHGESSLAVVDDDGSFLGLVPPTRLIGALLQDHDEDFARLGGYLKSTESARRAFEERLLARLWHRVPWLLAGLVGAALSAWLMGGFEETIARDIRLAFFVPGVVYLADAVGTQTEALIIRGLAAKANVQRAFGLEVLTGLAMGLLLAGLAFPAVWLVFGTADLALAVALALMAACSLATVVAMLLPWAMAKAGRDPAFGSGPLATVIQDLLSLLAFFLIAVPIVG